MPEMEAIFQTYEAFPAPPNPSGEATFRLAVAAVP